MSDLVIEIENLEKSFGKKKVLNGVTIRVPRKSVYGFLGNNGAGKSTTVRILLGLLGIDAGRVSIFGKELTRSDVMYKQRIGALIDSPCLYSHMTGLEYLRISQRIKGLTVVDVEQAMDQAGVTHFATERIRDFSMGMRQRLAIASALIGQPELLILDEPTNGLDPAGMQDIRDLLRGLPEASGTTVFVSSHLLDELQKFATHVGVLHSGEVVLESTLEDLIDSQRSFLEIQSLDLESLRKFLVDKQLRVQITAPETLVIYDVARGDCNEINRSIVEAGFGLIEARHKVPSLENVFLNLVELGGVVDEPSVSD